MRPAWRLATSSLAGKRTRTALLAGAAALSASLITAVACGMASVSASMRERLDATVGRADAQLVHVAGAAFEAEMLGVVRSWPEPAASAPRTIGPLPLRLGATSAVANGAGVDPDVERSLHVYPLSAGRFVEREGEVVLEHRLAEQLGAGVGDALDVPRFGDPITLEVVGILEKAPTNKLARKTAYVTRSQLTAHDSLAQRLVRVNIDLPDGADVEAFIERRQGELPRGLILEPSERASAGLNENIRVFQIGLFIWTVFAFLASSFIILTGLTTSVAERQRELAIVRCVGGTRGQIAGAQLLVGAIVGAAGALMGVPLGLALAWTASVVYAEHLPAGLIAPPEWLVIAAAGCVASGLAGAAWPAWRAARTAPLAALGARARSGSARTARALAGGGAAAVAVQPALALTLEDSQLIYWTYITAGAPLMLIGYFLLSVPATALAARALGPAVAGLVRVPRTLLTGAVAGAPVRHGLTAGSLMTGLALLVVIWTTGRAFLGSWVGAIQFPDAFVSSIAGLPDDTTARLEALPEVRETCAISMVRVQTELLGVQALRPLSSTFIAFEPDPFFEMTKLEWVEGDQASARSRLNAGGAVIVAREFAVARGLGVGDTFPFEFRGTKYEMDIAGVVSAPGLDIVGKYFDVGQQFKDQALHAVFGSRRDMVEKFGNSAVQFVQMDLADGYSDDEAMAAIREAFKGELITAGSGVEVKETIDAMGRASLKVVSSVAIAAMLIACFGVANVVAAGVHARAFEFGVIRAVGGGGATLARLIAGETLVVAIAASVVGTAMGLHAALAESVLWASLGGIDLDLSVQWDVIAAGAGTITVFALAASAPTALALARKPARELLAARG